MTHPLYPGGGAPALVALLGDTHGELTAMRRAADKAVDHTELILQLGDFGLWPGEDGILFLERITKWLGRRDMTLCWIDGNHDWHDHLDELPIDPEADLRQITDRIWHLPRGYRWNWNGTTWMALGGAVSADQDHRTPRPLLVAARSSHGPGRRARRDRACRRPAHARRAGRRSDDRLGRDALER